MRQSAVIQRNWQSLIKPEKLEVKPGRYSMHVDGGSIRAAQLKVGRERSSAQNDLLQP